MSTPDTLASTLVPRQKGKYSLYDTPDGGIHIAYSVEDSDEIQHIEVPGRIIEMAKMLDNGKMGPGQAFKLLKGMAGR